MHGKFPIWSVRNRSGFTLVELLVVIAIIAVLIGLLLSAVQMVREAANRARCQNNMRQIAISAQTFHDANQAFPQVEAIYPSSLAALLPFLEQDVLYQAIMSNPSGFSLTAAPPPLFACPSDRGVPTPAIVQNPNDGLYYGVASYLPNMTLGAGVIQPTSPINLLAVTDGTSNTILFGESSNYDPNWGQYAPFTSTPTAPFCLKSAVWSSKKLGVIPIGTGNLPLNSQLPSPVTASTAASDIGNRTLVFGSSHPNGANTAFCDGSVHFLSNAVNGVKIAAAAGSVTLLQALCTRAGGETIDATAF